MRLFTTIIATFIFTMANAQIAQSSYGLEALPGCAVYVPNAFTPNQDGDNDYFFPVSNCDYKSYDLEVYNRWGETVFRTNHPEVKWDGSARGTNCVDGVYYYRLAYGFEDYREYEYGMVTLLK